ncbi:MAG TPA: hypothetical protein VH500_18225, partial [Nitrososphaeraceae archaeon]
YLRDWYYDVFIPTYNGKSEPDSKIVEGVPRVEERIALISKEVVKATNEIYHRNSSRQQIYEGFIEPLINEGLIDSQKSAINSRNHIYWPVITDQPEGLIVDNFSQSKSTIDDCQRKVKLSDFERELPSGYIKTKIDEIVKSSSTGSAFFEILDHENSSISTEELVKKYFNHNISNVDKKNDPQKVEIVDDDETEPKSDSDSQTEKINRRYDQISTVDDRQNDTENNSTFSCKYCEFSTDVIDEYNRHIVSKHPRMPGYPDKNGRSPPIQ